MKKPRAILYDNDGMMTRGGLFSDKYSKEFGVDMAIMLPFFAQNGPFEKCLLGKADLKEELEKVLDVWGWKGTSDELMQYWFAVGDAINQDVYASIAKCKEQDLIVCLATNQEKHRLQYFIANFLYDKIFDELFYASKLGAFKHSIEGTEKIFQTLKEKYGITDKGEIMYWDDREKNVEGLNNMGFNAQQYRDYRSFKAVMTEYGFQL